MDYLIEAKFGTEPTIVIEPAGLVLNIAVCNESLQHVENSAQVQLVYDADVFAKIIEYDEFSCSVIKRDGTKVFTGQVVCDTGWKDIGEPYPIDELSLTIRDYTYKLQANTPGEIALIDTTFADVVVRIATDRGLLTTGPIPDIDIPAFVIKEGRQYLSVLDSFCFQHGLAFNFDAQGRMRFFDFSSIPSEIATLGESDLLSGVAPKKSKKKYAAVEVGYNTLSTRLNEQVYFESPGYDSDSSPTPVVIQPGVYYPFDATPTVESDEGQVYQSFESGYAETYKKYNGETGYRRSKSTTLLYSSNHRVVQDWTGPLVINRTGFESLRASVRFRNTGIQDASLNQFAIRADAIYRSADASVVVGPSASESKFDYEAEFLYASARAETLAAALFRFFTKANYLIDFSLDQEEIQPGEYRKLDTGLSGFSADALLLSYTLDCATEIYAYKAISVGAASVDVTRFKTQRPYDITPSIHDIQSQLDVITPVSGPAEDLPANVSSIVAKASRDYVTLNINSPKGTNVRNSPTGLIIQRSTESGAAGTWKDARGITDGDTTIPVGSYNWSFARGTDGYPEASGDPSPWAPLSAYRYRVKSVNALGFTSPDWTYCDVVDSSEYGTWLPAAPDGGVGSSSDRIIKIDWQDATIYGLARYEVQIAKQSADPTWYEPALGLDPMGSEDNYRQDVVVGGVRAVSISQFTHSVPLAGQNDAIPNPQDTAYIYRVRAVSSRTWSYVFGCEETEDGLTAGPWSTSIPALARATGAYDIVLRSIGAAQLALESIGAEHMSAKNLAAIFGYMAVISGGVEDENNRQILSDYPGRTLPIGYHRFGDSDFKVEFNPVTRKYYIGFVDGSKFIEFDAVAETYTLNGIEFKVTDKSVTAYSGQGVNRRAIRISGNDLDWLNAPDGGPEQLYARIGRLGVAGPVVIGGGVSTEVDSEWSGSSEFVIVNAQAEYEASIKTASGVIRAAYRSSTPNLREVTSSDDGATWSSPVTISTLSAMEMVYAELNDGTLHLYFVNVLNNYLYQMIRSGGAWGSPIPIVSKIVSKPAAIQDADGTVRLAYRYGGQIVEILSTDGGLTFGSEVPVDGSNSMMPRYFKKRDGALYLAFCNYATGYLYWRTLSGDAWINLQPLNEAQSAYPNLTEDLDGTIRLAYYAYGPNAVVERTLGESGWSSEVTIATVAFYPSYIQMDSGNLLAIYRNDSGYMGAKRLVRYQSLSYPITGYVAGRGWWTQFGDGTMIQRSVPIENPTMSINTYLHQVAQNPMSWALPIPFYDIDYNAWGTLAYSGNNGLSGYWGVYENSKSVNTVSGRAVLPTNYPAGTCYLRAVAIGRWKA